MAAKQGNAGGKRLVGKGKRDPAEADGRGNATKKIKAGKAKTAVVPIRTGEGGGGTGGGSPGELTQPPRTRSKPKRDVQPVRQK